MSATDLMASRLVRDLTGEMHDARYRALTYLAAHGAPAIEGRADDVAGLRAQAARSLAWLQAEARPAALVAPYDVYCDRWSPVFPY